MTVYFLYPQLRKLSGAERLILRLAAHAAALGGAVTLVTNYFDPVCRPALDPRVRLIETGGRANLFHNHYLDAPLEYVLSLRLLRHIGADAQALTFFGAPSLPALAWSKQFQRTTAPRLYFCYEPPRFIYDDTTEILARLAPAPLRFPARPAFAIYRRLDRALAQRADALLANSAFGAERLRAAYGREATVITHGTDLGQAAPAEVVGLRARYHLDGKRVLLNVGFLHPRKRIDLFLRTVALVRVQVPGTVGLIVGSGPEEARLRGLARALHIESDVIFAGFVPDAELPAHYGLADLYLHTCKLESFGLSVLEASAAGVPVVAVDEGGPREIVVSGETGALVAAEPEALAGATVELLRDAQKRLMLGANARRRVQELYSWDRGARTLLDLVQELTGGQPISHRG